MEFRDRPSPNHGPRRGDGIVDILVLHYTGMDAAASALDRLCDPASEVSAHYLVDEGGVVWRLAPEGRRAWHAGASSWAGDPDVNSRSIGVELANPGHGPDYRPFAEPQMAALEQLCHDVLGRHSIPPARILGHSDVAPSRKQDPGELFDWRRLAAAGIGLWPNAAAGIGLWPDAAAEMAPEDDLAWWMRRFGYADGGADAIAAFQRHFRPRSITGQGDDETRALVAHLVKQAGLA